MEWIYTVNKGLKHSINPSLDLLFGMTRESIRHAFSYNLEFNEGRFEDEDSFTSIMGYQNQWVRPGFRNNLLSEVEVLQGTIIFGNIRLQTHTGLKNTLSKLKANGYIFQETAYSYVSYSEKIDIGDSEKNGGIEDLIYWLLISQDLSYIELL